MGITQIRDPDSILLGLGVLGLAAWSGTSPPSSPAGFIDVGYIKACGVAYTREVKEFESAGLLVKRVVFRDRFNLTADWAEVSMDNLATVIPGTLVGDALHFGGNRTVSHYAVRFEHTRTDNLVLTINVFKSIVSGNVELNFAEEEFITYPVEFSAELDSTRPTGRQYASIRTATA